MAARDTAAYPDRRLRGAVADLARRSADDIEAIWYVLSEAEREQLRPLLADASSILSRDAEQVASVLHMSVPDGGSNNLASDLVRLARYWPDELVALAIRHADETTREKCVEALPDEHRVTLSRIPARTTLTPHARDALLNAVRRDASTLPTVHATSDTKHPIPTTWRHRLRRMLRPGLDT